MRKSREKKENCLRKFSFLLILCISLLILSWTFFQTSDNVKATNVAGLISTDTNWTLADSPYIINDNIVIDNGVTLTIEPGTWVIFDGYYSMTVKGNLIARGNQTQKINFISAQPLPDSSDWNTINIQTQGYAEFDFCEISYGRKGIYILKGGEAQVKNCSLKNLQYGIQMDGARNISVNNVQFIDVYYGIDLNSCINITVSKSRISHAEEGIKAFTTHDSTISDIKIWNISKYGLYASHCSNFLISDIQMWNLSDYGLHLRHCSNFTISSSHFESQKEGYLHITGTPTPTYTDHHILNSTINGKPIVYLTGLTDMILENIDAGHIILSASTNVTLSHCNSKGGEGITFYYTDLCTLRDSTISESLLGLYLYNTMGDNVINNSIDNSTYGCKMYNSEGNTLTDNDFEWNDYGFHLEKSYSNHIYHNNNILNEEQVIEFGTSMRSKWDNGEEGNYWSDYTGTDSTGDGIGDSNYLLGRGSSDRYPLMVPWTGKLPPDTVPPFFITVFGSLYSIVIPEQGFEIQFRPSEYVHYEIIIDTDGTTGTDNRSDRVLSGNATGSSQMMWLWRGTDVDENYVEDGEHLVQIMMWDRAGNPLAEPFIVGNVTTTRDTDMDGVIDRDDAFPLDPFETLDSDNDGIGDNSDEDWDNDGVENNRDEFPWDRTEWKDSDSDGKGDNEDPDDDNDGISDNLEIPLGLGILMIPILTFYFVNRGVKTRIKNKNEKNDKSEPETESSENH